MAKYIVEINEEDYYADNPGYVTVKELLWIICEKEFDKHIVGIRKLDNNARIFKPAGPDLSGW